MACLLDMAKCLGTLNKATVVLLDIWDGKVSMDLLLLTGGREDLVRGLLECILKGVDLP